MGAKQTKNNDSLDISLNKKIETRDEIAIDEMDIFSYGLAEPHEVQHYVPPNFPILPVLTPSYLQICAKTWDMIQMASTERMKQYGKPGIVLFYDEFFFRLFQRDATMEDVFPSIKKRGEVLVKALSFILSMKADSNQDIDNSRNKSLFMGHKHRTFSKVRPHHFANYVSTCIEVIMYWLGESGSPEVGESWSNVAGFVLRHILGPFLYKRVDPYESYQNTEIVAVREIEMSMVNEKTEDGGSQRSEKSGRSTRSARSHKSYQQDELKEK